MNAHPSVRVQVLHVPAAQCSGSCVATCGTPWPPARSAPSSTSTMAPTHRPPCWSTASTSPQDNRPHPKRAAGSKGFDRVASYRQPAFLAVLALGLAFEAVWYVIHHTNAVASKTS